MTTCFFMVSILACTGFSASLAAQSPVDITPSPADETRCIETDQIRNYRVETDERVRVFMKNSQQMLLRLKRQCPQLRFHRYFSYTPTDGKICAGVDEIKTRAGLACRIASVTPVPDATEIQARKQP